MEKQTVRQQARVRARQARAKVREVQAKRARRLARWGKQVAVALAERDAAVIDYEQQAGRTLRALIEQEGLSTQEALGWCGADTLTGREVHRLMRGVVDEDEDEDAMSGGNHSADLRDAADVALGAAESMPG